MYIFGVDSELTSQVLLQLEKEFVIFIKILRFNAVFKK